MKRALQIVGIGLVACLVLAVISVIINPNRSGTSSSLTSASPGKVSVTIMSPAKVATTGGAVVVAPSQSTDIPLTIAPAATLTPIATLQPVATQAPVVINGAGDSVVEIQYDKPGALRVTGNAGAVYFGIIAFDKNNNRLGSVVNTIDVYKGVVPINFDSREIVTRLQVKAEGDWTIEVVPLSAIRQLSVPGEITGTGDDLILLVGGNPDIATVKGNSSAAYFGVIAYGDRGRLGSIVNTTDPYEGSQPVENGTALFEIKAIGEWNITMSERK